MTTILYFGMIFLHTLFGGQNAIDISGTWYTEGNASTIQIVKSGDLFKGTLIALKEPRDSEGREKMDKNNPDQGLRTRPIIGITILENLAYKNGEYTNGTIYSPEKGFFAKCKMKLINQNTLELTVSKGMITAHKTWKRAN